MIETGTKVTGLNINKSTPDGSLTRADSVRVAEAGSLAAAAEAMSQRVDLLLTPVGGTADTTAARVLRFGEDPELILSMRYTCPFDMSGSPTITMPAGFNAAGAPMAIELVGRHFDEQLLVQLGDAYQQATAGTRRIRCFERGEHTLSHSPATLFDSRLAR